MDRFQEIKAFLAIAETGSFTAGARVLKTSSTSMTRIIAGLEKRLNTRLFSRNTRSVKLTEAGEGFLEDCKRIMAALEDAEEQASGSAKRARGNLHVTAPVLFGELFLMPAIAGYMDAHPEVSVKVTLFDRIVDLIDERMDVAVRIGHLPDMGLYAKKVGQVRPVICAAPSLLDEIGRPCVPRDLLKQPLVMSSSSPISTEWHFKGPERPITLRPKSRLVVNSNGAAIRAARLGKGITRVLSYQVAEDVARGSLELVLEDFAVPPMPISLVYEGGANIPAKIRTFVDYCYSVFSNDPALQNPLSS